MNTTSLTILKSSRHFRAGFAGLALSVFAALGVAQNAHTAPTGQSNNQAPACPTPPSHSSPPPAQPSAVTVVNPVTVTGTVDIGHTVQIAGTVQTLNDALKIPFHRTVRAASSQSLYVSVYTVPAGMRLIIESVSSGILVPSGQKVFATLTFSGENSSSFSQDYLPLMSQGVFHFGVDEDMLVSSQNLKIIVDSTSPQINYNIYRNSTSGDVFYDLTINGYLEEAP